VNIDEDGMGQDGVVRVGEKLLLVERKRFAEGRSRGIVGTVEAVSGDLIRLHGWQWIYRAVPSGYARKDHAVTVVMRLDNDVLAMVLPDDCRVEALSFTLRGNFLTVSDGAGFEYVDTLHAPGG
jgi:hypothetical protein